MSPFERFKTEAPEVFQAFGGFIQTLAGTPALDAKTKQLIYIGMKTALGDVGAVKAHVPMARAAGVTRDELRDCILLSLSVCGLSGVNACLGPALDAYDQLP